MTKTIGKRTRGAAATMLIVLAIAGCGGGGGGGGTAAPPAGGGSQPNPGGGITGTGSAMAGAMTVSGGGATIAMNGVTMTTTGATVRIDDNPKGLNDLQNGMVGKVRGRINDDRVSGTATTIEIENEVRGLAANVDPGASPQTFTVNNQRVYVDSQTVYANLPGFAGIAAGTLVEVHGFRDSAGAIRATRVESQTPGAGAVDEVRGTVTALGTGSFTLGTAPNALTVAYTGATTFAPAGAAASGLQVGLLVEVHGNFSAGTFNATRIDFEDTEDSSFVPGATENAEVEGIISGFTGTAAEFRVGTRRVILGTSVRFEGGNATDLANDARVEAEGNLNSSGVLVANKIQFKAARIVLQSTATAVTLGSLTNPGELVVLGKTVVVTSVTKVDTTTGLLSAIVNGDCVEVRARLDGTTIVADEVKELGASACDRWIVRGPVAAQDSAAVTVTLIATSGANSAVVNVNGAEYRDASDAPITRANFFAGARVGSIVKTRGNNPATSPLVATEAELEN